jgi:GGDEF domain-containing protein
VIVAERLRTEVAELHVSLGAGGEGRGQLTLSVGLGAHPEHGATARELLLSVRRARDRAHILGGNVVMQAGDALEGRHE